MLDSFLRQITVGSHRRASACPQRARRCSTLFSMAQAGVAHRVDHVLDSFLRQITVVRGDVVELYLYGSRARGDHHPDSDYDVFVVLHERTRDTIDRLYDAVVDVVCETGSLVSLKIVSREQFWRLVVAGNPLVANVLHEGVPLALNQ